MNTLRSRGLLTGFAMVFATLLATAALGYLNVRRLYEYDRLVDHSHQVVSALRHLFGLVADAESGIRGYVITSDASYLKSFDAAKVTVPDVIGRIERLTADNLEQQATVSELKKHTARRMDLMMIVVEAAQQGGSERGQNEVAKGEGRATMELVRDAIRSLERREDALLTKRIGEATVGYWTAVVSSLISAIIGLLLAALGLLLTSRDLKARELRAQELNVLNERLEERVRERTAAISQTNAALRVEVAERQRAEEKVRLVAEELEQRVEQRTAELNCLNEALRAEIAERKRAEQALRDADRRKDEFLATLAHELRNPLAPLTAAIQLIAAEPGRTEQIRELVGMMTQQLDQLIRLIDDLVDVSRITSGKLRLRSEPALLSEWIQGAVDQSRPLIESARHTLVLALPAEPLVVHGDKVRLAQIVSNLLINAAKYTPPNGRIELVVSHADGQAAIAVRDNGIGIPPEMQARIFDLFAQVDSSSTRSHGGLGIGLTIVRTLVEMHGGSICATSAGSGQGSEFVVRLPLAPSNSAKRAPPPAHGDEPLPELKILLVDDNQSAAHMMCRLLQKLGQEVHVADSGRAALVQVPQVVPDIIISDVAMPGMSGYDLAREIRGLDLPRRPYLVAVTGYGQDSDRQDALAAGFDKHLTKPVGVGTLEELLRSRAGRR